MATVRRTRIQAVAEQALDPEPLLPRNCWSRDSTLWTNSAAPLGFGNRDTATSSIKVTDADMREAEDRMRRYDENRDGYLDKEEISRNRWNDDPYSFDSEP